MNSDIQSQLVSTNPAPTIDRKSVDQIDESKRFGSHLSHKNYPVSECISTQRPNNSTRLLKKVTNPSNKSDHSINYQNLMNDSKITTKLPNSKNQAVPP